MFLKNLKIASSFALRDVSRSKGVLLLTVLSLGIVYAAVFISGGVLSGFSDALKSGSIDSSGEITVYLKEERTQIEVDEIRKKLLNADNIQGISIRSHGGASYAKKGKHNLNSAYTFIGIDLEDEQKTTLVSERVVKGRFLQKDDINSVVIGISIADSLEGKLYDGKSIDIGQIMTFRSMDGIQKDFTVVGIIDAKYFHPNWTAYFLKDDLEYLDNSRSNDEIAVKIVDAQKINESKKVITEMIPGSLVATWAEREGYVMNLVDAIGYITGNISRLLILTTFVLTSVFIFINVFQRRRQIGILKSMGASNFLIGYIYFIETVIFSILSFGIGFGIFLVANIFTKAFPSPSLVGDISVVFNNRDFFYSVGSLVLASIIGSVLPIYFALKVEIAEVIRNSS